MTTLELSAEQSASAQDVVERTAGIVDLLRDNARRSEDERRLPGEVVDAMTEAGIFRLRRPERFGGLEADTATLGRVAAELARGDGAAAWTAGVWWIATWMVGMFPDETQDEIYSTDPDLRVCGTLSPGGTLTPADGGYLLNGKWGFISGAQNSHWQEIIAIDPTHELGPVPVMGMVPISDLQIVDDWYTSGLQGSGSVSTVAQDVFVPAARTLPLPAVLMTQYASPATAERPVWRAPMLSMASATSAGVGVGLARAAHEAFFDRLPGRKITYTAYESQQEAPITHHEIAEATYKLDEAQFHLDRLTGAVDGKGLSGEPWTPQERILARAWLGRAAQLARESTGILADASGGSSIYLDVPIQRLDRDVHAVTMHALMHPKTNAELYGRALAGLEPNTQYL